jgi:hypothetical protein
VNDADRIKRNVLLLIISVGVGAALMWWFARQHAQPKTKPEVTIKDGQTIDFSSGHPVVSDSQKDKAIIDAAVKEMDEAARGVTFKPTATKPAAPPPKQ